MTLSLLLSLIGFAAASTFTPGPNSVMIIASCANFGYRRTLPHIFGVSAGALCVILATGFGLGQLILGNPTLHTVFKVVSAAYLLYLGYKIATAAPRASSTSTAKPFTAWQAALFQIVNPKLWAAALTLATFYMPGGTLPVILTVATLFATIMLTANLSWGALGALLTPWLSIGKRQHRFNIASALLLIGSLALAFTA